jgi:hypothetical protein
MAGDDDDKPHSPVTDAAAVAAAQAVAMTQAVVAAELAALAAMVAPDARTPAERAAHEAEIEDGFDNMPV